MAAGESVTALIDELVRLFNRRSMDLPDGYFTRHTQFLLNGVPFESMLGRSADDPLILMLTRGAAGYRFTAKAVQHAVPDAKLQRGELTESEDGGRRTVRVQCWLEGHLRGTGEPVHLLVDVALGLEHNSLTRIEATLDRTAVERLHEARLRP